MPVPYFHLACHLIGLEPRLVPLLEAARAQGLGATALADLEIVGEDWRTLQRPDFEKVSELEDLLRVVPLPKGMLRWVREQWTARPRILGARCSQCGVCADGCPVIPAAIHPAAPPTQQIDDDACIRCYCCQEFCPNQAIALERSRLIRCLRLEPLAGRAGRLVSQLWPRRNHADRQCHD
jgi:ferredoxin